MTVVAGEEPVRVVTHWDDGDWTFADGVHDPNGKGNAILACIEHLLDTDDSLVPLATMPPGTVAWRNDQGESWTIEAHAYEE
ncbi:hypothetical protein [Nocardia arthritidis]|uniref:Uncharacterized protein n=1 Tax=Nocardia arthritidis TaxID=228602 RepID=A0A6G9Y9L3_9NOCA|nr:hypothetical protein [Nocardia arthritidis]QIS09912.1 hypothetical protein F5544_10065 [Nocardia arthritidis]